MKRALMFTFAIAAMMPTKSQASLFNPWGIFGRPPCTDSSGHSQRGHRHANGGGFVAEGASVQPSTFIAEGGEVCGGASVGPFARIGPDAKIWGSVNIVDASYVNAHVYGNVTISNSRVTTSEVIDSSGVRTRYGGGIRIMNSRVEGEAVVRGSAQLTQVVVAGDAEITGNAEICNVEGAITHGRYASGVHGHDCDSVLPAYTPTVAGGAVYDRNLPDSNRNFGYGAPPQQQGYSPQSGTCYQWDWDYTRGVWGCRSGGGATAYRQPAYGSPDSFYDRGGGTETYRYVQVEGGYWAIPRSWDEYRQRYGLAGQQPRYAQPGYETEQRWSGAAY